MNLQEVWAEKLSMEVIGDMSVREGHGCNQYMRREGLGKVGRVREEFGFILVRRNGEASRFFKDKSFATEEAAVKWLEARGTWGKGIKKEEGVWFFFPKDISRSGARIIVRKL